MRSKKLKKAFTLVELVVVIAVIAVLAGVSVGAYFGITETANKSAAQQHVKQMNDMLVISNILDGMENKTFHDARIDVAQQGLDVCVLKEFGSYRYAWNSKTDRFTIVDLNKSPKDGPATVIYPEEQEVNDKSSLFLVANSIDDISAESGFSYYLNDDFATDEDTIYIGGGIDTGYAKPNSITLTKSSSATGKSRSSSDNENIIIRTNHFYTEVTITAPDLEIDHYGYSLKVHLVDHKDGGYNEHGIVGRLIVNQKQKGINLLGSSQIYYLEADESYVTNYAQFVSNVNNLASTYKCDVHETCRIASDIRDVYSLCLECGTALDEEKKEQVVLGEDQITEIPVKYSIGHTLEEKDFNYCDHVYGVTAPYMEGTNSYTHVTCKNSCGFNFVAYNFCKHIWELLPEEENGPVFYHCIECNSFETEQPRANVTQYRLDIKEKKKLADENPGKEDYILTDEELAIYNSQSNMFDLLDRTIDCDSGNCAVELENGQTHRNDLDVAYRFQAVDTSSNQSSIYNEYQYYGCDYVVSFTRARNVDMDDENADGQNIILKSGTLGLWGYYEKFNRGLGFHSPMDIFEEQKIPLLSMMGPIMFPDYEDAFTYEMVINWVDIFDCGAFNCSSENSGLTMTVTLGMWEAHNSGEIKMDDIVNNPNPDVVIGSWSYTF